MLIRWKGGILTTHDIHEFALKNFGLDDTETEDLAVNEILGIIDNLDMNLLCSEDIPFLLELLDNPKFVTAEVIEHEYAKYMKSINIQKRKNLLSSDPMYAPFCK